MPKGLGLDPVTRDRLIKQLSIDPLENFDELMARKSENRREQVASQESIQTAALAAELNADLQLDLLAIERHRETILTPYPGADSRTQTTLMWDDRSRPDCPALRQFSAKAMAQDDRERNKSQVKAMDDQEWDEDVQMLRDAMKIGLERFKSDPSVRSAGYIAGSIPHFNKDTANMLFPYQREGVGQILTAFKNIGGAMLADGMGLGKTLQSIAIVACRTPKTGETRPSLVIVPSNAMTSWRHEIEKCGLFQYAKGSGVLFWDERSKAECRQMRRDQLSKYKLIVILHSELCQLFKLMAQTIMEFAALRRGYLHYQTENGSIVRLRGDRSPCAIFGVGFNLVIMDEAHVMRNENMIYRAACQLEAKYRLAVSGTFVVNAEDDLYPIVQFLRIKPFSTNPGLFHYFFSTGKDQYEPKKQWSTRERLQVLSLLVASFTTRRFQGEFFEGTAIASVNWLQEDNKEVELTKGEQDRQKEVGRYWHALGKDFCDSKGGKQEKKRNDLAAMTKARTGLVHPGAETYSEVEVLYRPRQGRPSIQSSEDPTDDTALEVVFMPPPYDQAARVAFRKYIAEYNAEGIRGYNSTIIRCALDTLKTHIEDGAIVHCEFLKGLDAFRVGLERELPQCRIYEYTGAMSAHQRNQAELQFNQDCQLKKKSVMLMTNAGSTGLSFPHASCMVHLTPSWSQAEQAQRTARGMRITRDKLFYNCHIRAKNSISCRQLSLCSKKMLLSDYLMVRRDDLKHIRITALRQKDPLAYIHLDNNMLWAQFPGEELALDQEIKEIIDDMRNMMSMKLEDFLEVMRGQAPDKALRKSTQVGPDLDRLM